MNSGCDVVLCWRGTLYWPCLCSRFRNRSPQFAALHLSSIMQDNHTNTVQATRKACISERGLRTAPSSISLCVCPETFDRVLVQWSTGAHVPEAGTGICERCGISILFRSIYFSYSLCYRQACLEALNRNQEPDLEEARKISVLTGLVQGQAYIWGFLLMAGA